MITLDRFPEIRSMMGGTLDDKSVVQPQFSVWCSEGQSWVELPRGIARHPEYPDGTFGVTTKPGRATLGEVSRIGSHL
jgi:hypothetical protein